MYRVATPDDLTGDPAGPAWTNRLADETSPYLLQHAHNPVDWHPWGREAFDKAQAEGKPIFLSIGYAACHWCHVMEHESFADPRVAVDLNRWFVPIKVDREERPDVDAIYIEALQAFQGHAGWPANLFLLPDRRPFAGITYLPPVDRPGMPSFRSVLARVRSFWETRRADLVETGEALREALGKGFSPAARGAGAVGFVDAVKSAVAAQDPLHAGLGGGQKFPQTSVYEMLLLGAHDGVEGASHSLTSALTAMARGGLRDHLGGGFHRYCVDRAWTVPHFEKMLYDNAQLLRLYARAASWLQDVDLERSREAVRATRDTARYLALELTGPDGLLWASEDADDPGGEGFFYTFTAAEARAVLGDDVPLPYGITDEGNFEHGRTVLSTWSGRPLERVRNALLDARSARARPAVDTKRVVAWNGLAIGALAEAGRLHGFVDWIDRAAAAADALLAAIGDAVPRVIGGTAPGTLEDHAFLADGLLDLFQACPAEVRWLDTAVSIVQRAAADLRDPAGGFFQAAARPDLIVRRKDFHDGAEPSGNGRMASVLRRLGAYGAPLDPAWLDGLLDAAQGWMANAPLATPELWGVARAMALGASGPLELVISGRPDHPESLAMLRAWNRSWRPQGIVAIGVPGSSYSLLDKPPGPNGAPRAYLCRQGVCGLPVDTADALSKQL